MNIGLYTDCFGHLSFEELLIKCNELGIEDIELGCGNWSGAPHIDVDLLIKDSFEVAKMKELLQKYKIKISALNCSGNPLTPDKKGEENRQIILKTFKVAKLLDITTIVSMSGLPPASKDDISPNWIITSWPPETQTILDYQWNEVLIPYWKSIIPIAKSFGIKKIALEPHGFQLVHNVENFKRLRQATDDIIGFNLDPSHLFWMGADPLSVIRELQEEIYHIHIKDIRIEKIPASKNTLLDGKPVLDFKNRSWNFCVPGNGHSEIWWSEFITLLKMYGYDGTLSIENEDYTMEAETAVTKTVQLLKKIKI